MFFDWVSRLNVCRWMFRNDRAAEWDTKTGRRTQNLNDYGCFVWSGGEDQIVPPDCSVVGYFERARRNSQKKPTKNVTALLM
jgi:hypothetical protein